MGDKCIKYTFSKIPLVKYIFTARDIQLEINTKGAWLTFNKPFDRQAVMKFQDVLITLQNYWSSRGCVIHQPYDIEVGAGTFNPTTFFRVLGPEPYSAAYVEPSRRPTDGRYGKNPNRLQHYYQYQVILKPSPDEAQRLYLDSLVALGIDPKKHDIRFVEDDWESPTLGAWGLGWEVWLTVWKLHSLRISNK